MVRTKQTTRNPNIDRTVAVVGSESSPPREGQPPDLHRAKPQLKEANNPGSTCLRSYYAWVLLLLEGSKSLTDIGLEW